MINSSKGVISEIEWGNLPLRTPHSIHDILPQAYPFNRALLKASEGHLGSLTSRM
jgi:hypothetical protein